MWIRVETKGIFGMQESPEPRPRWRCIGGFPLKNGPTKHKILKLNWNRIPQFFPPKFLSLRIPKFRFLWFLGVIHGFSSAHASKGHYPRRQRVNFFLSLLIPPRLLFNVAGPRKVEYFFYVFFVCLCWFCCYIKWNTQLNFVNYFVLGLVECVLREMT